MEADFVLGTRIIKENETETIPDLKELTVQPFFSPLITFMNFKIPPFT